MTAPQSTSPASLTGHVVAGCALMLASLVAIVIVSASYPSSICGYLTDRLRFSAIPFLLFLGGTYLALRAESHLRKGIRTDQWTAQQLESTRRWVTGRSWLFLTCLPAITWLILLIFRHGNGWGLLFVTVMLPMQIFLRIRTLLNPPQLTAQINLPPSAAPIRSEHWGETPQAFPTSNR